MNESFEKVASYGLLPNMIFYLMNGYNLEAASGSIILSLWNAASNTMAVFGAFLSDSYLGRFRVIALGTCSSLLVSQFLKISEFLVISTSGFLLVHGKLLPLGFCWIRPGKYVLWIHCF